MAVSLDRFVDVTISRDSQTVSVQGFGTLTGVNQIDVGIQPERTKIYGSLAELTDAGFVPTDRAYQWAQVAFSQVPRPNVIALGRRVPGVQKVINYQITADAVGTWQLAIDDGNGNIDTYPYVSAGADPILVADGLREQIAQDPNAIVTVPEDPVGVDNVDITALISGTDFTVTITPPGAGTETTTVVTPNTDPEDITTALNAIEAEEGENAGFYFTIDTRSDDDVTDAAAWAAARPYTKFFVAQTSQPEMRMGVAGNLGLVLNGLGYQNTVLMWHSQDAALADAGMAAVAAAADLDGEGGAITWKFKELIGVPVDDLSSAEITNIVGDRVNGLTGAYANVYLRVAGQNVTIEGQAVSGDFADLWTTDAWAVARLQEGVFGAMANQPAKLPFTNSGIAIIQSTCLGVLNTGVTNGHYSGDVPGQPLVAVPTSNQVAGADKQNRILRNVRLEATYSGAIHHVIMTLNMEF